MKEHFSEVHNDESDYDILIQLGNLRDVVANFQNAWTVVSMPIGNAKPHVRGLVRQLQKDGKGVEAERIRKIYEFIVTKSQELVREVNAIELPPPWARK